MLTNIVATIVVVVNTNYCHPKQIQQTNILPTYPVQEQMEWLDVPGVYEFGSDYYFSFNAQTRDNPNVRFVETRRLRYLQFTLEGKKYNILISEEVIDRKRQERIIIETWKDEEDE